MTNEEYFESMFPSLVNADAFTIGNRRFVSMDKVLETIDELNDTKALAKATPPGSYLHKTYARRLKGAVKALKGGESG